MSMPNIPEKATLEEIRAFFVNDKFATKTCGAYIVEASKGHAIVRMEVQEAHLNAHGEVMGGALFTIADFALAVASNVGELPTVAVSNTIEYMNTVKGSVLIAECTTEKSGRTLGFYTVYVRDDQGVLVAKMTATCARKAIS